MFLERLKLLREKAGNEKIMQSIIADHIGVAQNTYANYENGKRSVPDDIKLKLADFFGVSLDYLFGRSDVIWPQRRAAHRDDCPNSERLSLTQAEILKECEKLSPAQQNHVLAIVKTFTSQSAAQRM